MKSFDQKNVEVRRGQEKIHVVVPAHEVIVLRAVHRPEHVSVLGDADEPIELDESIGAEWARLKRIYPAPSGTVPAVQRAFHAGPEMLKEFGFGGEAVTVGPQQDGSGVRDHRAKAKAKAASTKK